MFEERVDKTASYCFKITGCKKWFINSRYLVYLLICCFCCVINDELMLLIYFRKLGIDSASQVASDISNAISAQKAELDDRKRSVNMLQKALVSLFRITDIFV